MNWKWRSSSKNVTVNFRGFCFPRITNLPSLNCISKWFELIFLKWTLRRFNTLINSLNKELILNSFALSTQSRIPSIISASNPVSDNISIYLYIYISVLLFQLIHQMDYHILYSCSVTFSLLWVSLSFLNISPCSEALFWGIIFHWFSTQIFMIQPVWLTIGFQMFKVFTLSYKLFIPSKLFLQIIQSWRAQAKRFKDKLQQQ